MIITTSSINGLDGALVAYGTSKGLCVSQRLYAATQTLSIAGVAGMTLPLAKELADFGIRVMSIAPGPFGKG